MVPRSLQKLGGDSPLMSTPTYVDRTLCTQAITYVHRTSRIDLHMHKSKLRTQAQAYAQAQIESVLRHFQAYIIQINPKHVLTLSNVSVFHLNLSHNKDQAFTWPKHIKTEDQRETWKWEKVEKLTNSAIGMWFFGRYVNEGDSINLTALLQRVRRNAMEERTLKVFLALGAIERDEESLERKWENEGVLREWENQMMWGKERRGKFL